MFLGIGFILLAVILLIFTTAISLLILWLVKKLKLNPRYRLIALFPFVFVTVGLYFGITDPHDLYEEHFEEITGLELPGMTEFIEYTDWGYFSSPSQNSSLFYIEVEPAFYEKVKKKLKPAADQLPDFNQEVRYRLENEFDGGLLDKIDYHFLRYDSDGHLLYFVGFIEEESSMLVHAWKD